MAKYMIRDLPAAAEAVVTWYEANKVSLPWRQDPTPYHVWISEIMLQQTRIEAVIPYYLRFLETLPDVKALSEVSEDRLLKLWEGLGYYSRARNLKKAAIQIMNTHGGRIPHKADDLRKLAGIGDYTAGAISSIAFGEPEPAVDGNVLRVMMRLAACSDDVMQQTTKNRVAETLRGVYPCGKAAGALTEGLMELGERLCLPNGIPLCENCPLRAFCAAYSEGDPMRYPTRTKPKPRRVEEKTVLLIRTKDQWGLSRRPPEGLLGGLWELPNLPGNRTEREVEEYLRTQGLTVVSIQPCGKHKHIFSHMEWHMTGFSVETAEPVPDLMYFSGAEIGTEVALPTAFSAYRKYII